MMISLLQGNNENTGTIFVIYGAILVVIFLVCGFYLVQTLRAIRDLLKTVGTLLTARNNQLQGILENISSTTQGVKLTTSRVNDLVRRFISWPDFAANFGKHIFQSIFKK